MKNNIVLRAFLPARPTDLYDCGPKQKRYFAFAHQDNPIKAFPEPMRKQLITSAQTDHLENCVKMLTIMSNKDIDITDDKEGGFLIDIHEKDLVAVFDWHQNQDHQGESVIINILRFDGYQQQMAEASFALIDNYYYDSNSPFRMRYAAKWIEQIKNDAVREVVEKTLRQIIKGKTVARARRRLVGKKLAAKYK